MNYDKRWKISQKNPSKVQFGPTPSKYTEIFCIHLQRTLYLNAKMAYICMDLNLYEKTYRNRVILHLTLNHCYLFCLQIQIEYCSTYRTFECVNWTVLNSSKKINFNASHYHFFMYLFNDTFKRNFLCQIRGLERVNKTKRPTTKRKPKNSTPKKLIDF